MALGIAACGGGGGGPSGTANPNQNATGTPKFGGTLNILSAGDVDHIDPASAYYVASYVLERVYARQLVSYPASTDIVTANSIVADVATQVPTKDNGGISADGKTYTFHLRSGVKWNTSPPRDVTSQDFKLGIKRLCNPVNPVGAEQYYDATIVGFKDFCTAFLAQTAQDAPSMKAYIQSHDIPGITTPDPTTIVFKLLQQAGDFLNILALPFASAAPAEYLNYVPDDATFRTHTISDGPYQISSYSAAKEVDFVKNPAWQQSSDPLRFQYVDAIKLVEGSNEGAVQQQIEAGTADLSFDTLVPTADIPRLQSTHDPRLGIFPTLDSNPFLIFNLQSPNNNGLLKNVKVRQALEYAVDKVALVQEYGGPNIATPLNHVIPPGNLGSEDFNPYPTPGNKGDGAKCKSLLAAAGYPQGFTLKEVYRTNGHHPHNFQIIQQDFAKCGVTVTGVPVPPHDFYTKYLQTPSVAQAGTWDIAAPGWLMDWFGNNGRAFISPIFDGRAYGVGSTDWMDFNSSVVNSLIDRALAATDLNQAASLWHQADVEIMKDAPFIPWKTDKNPLMRSTRVHNAIFSPFSAAYDISVMWLA